MSIYYFGSIAYDSEYLAHYGIIGQKWGIRRYQNPDGTLTNAGRARYSKGDAEHDLGLGDKKRLNTLEKRFRDTYRGYKNTEDKNYKKAAVAKSKGKDASKYIDRAKKALKEANMQKRMNENYQNLDLRERKRVNRGIVAGQYSAALIGGIPMSTISYLVDERYLRERFGK